VNKYLSNRDTALCYILKVVIVHKQKMFIAKSVN